MSERRSKVVRVTWEHSHGQGHHEWHVKRRHVQIHVEIEVCHFWLGKCYTCLPNMDYTPRQKLYQSVDPNQCFVLFCYVVCCLLCCVCVFVLFCCFRVRGVCLVWLLWSISWFDVCGVFCDMIVVEYVVIWCLWSILWYNCCGVVLVFVCCVLVVIVGCVCVVFCFVCVFVVCFVLFVMLCLCVRFVLLF